MKVKSEYRRVVNILEYNTMWFSLFYTNRTANGHLVDSLQGYWLHPWDIFECVVYIVIFKKGRKQKSETQTRAWNHWNTFAC